MNRTSTVMILGESWRFGNLHDRATTILNRLKHSGLIAVDCGRGLNRSSTVAESGSFLVAPWVESWAFLNVRVNRGITDIPIHLSHENRLIVHICRKN